ncbi:MAG: hypothetical protein M0026_13405 [Nocardiopsaceae bacterium]|nr:hypothetical protein [Nocardiopsaceae bacterium]
MRRLPPGWRKAVLSVHVIASVGWLGVHACLVALLAIGLAADGPARAGAAYTAAGMLVQTLVAPVSLTSLGTGLVLSSATPWGLFRHYWVAAKLVLTILLVFGSNLSLGPAVVEMAAAAQGGTAVPPDSDRLRYVVALSVALCALLAATLLSTVKPFGRIRPPQRG